MKISQVLHWILRIAVFALILLLVLDNMQAVDFNLLGIYQIKLPLIAIILIVFVLGIILGFLFGMLRGFARKSEIKKLENEIKNLKSKTHI